MEAVGGSDKEEPVIRLILSKAGGLGWQLESQLREPG